MRKLLLSLLVTACTIAAVAAVEPQIPDQIFPAAAQFKLIQHAEDDGSFLFVETTTMGRVGADGYVWTMLLRAIPGSTPEVTRMVINCDFDAITEDWITIFDANLQPAAHRDSDAHYAAVDPTLQQVVGLACSGQPAQTGQPSLRDAVDWARAQPPTVYEPEPDNIINVTETGPGGTYRASWIRRPLPGNRIYDGTWIYLPTGEITTDTVVVGPIINGVQSIERTSTGGAYKIPYYGAFPQKGTASWVSDPGYSVEISVLAENPDVTMAGLVGEQPRPPAESLSDGNFPPDFNSFVQINEGDLPVPLKVFYDENSPTFQDSNGVARAWQFYAYATPLKYPSGADSIGGWVRMDYQCDARPIAWSPSLVVQVGADYQNLPSVQPNPQRFEAVAGSVEEGVANNVCSGTPMPLIASLPRFEGIPDAIREAGK